MFLASTTDGVRRSQARTNSRAGAPVSRDLSCLVLSVVFTIEQQTDTILLPRGTRTPLFDIFLVFPLCLQLSYSIAISSITGNPDVAATIQNLDTASMYIDRPPARR